jgi:hypothetical protein
MDLSCTGYRPAVDLDADTDVCDLGCTLGGIDRFAYPRLPGEVQLLWRKALQAPGDGPSG